MRAIRSLLLATLLFSGAAFAQAGEPPPPAAAPVADAAPAASDAAATGQTTVTEVSPQASAAAQTSDEEFTLRVKTMEEQVNDLKEKIFRTKARLLLLQESILGGNTGIQGAKAVLIHRNEMGGSFVLESVAYALDGAPVYTKVDVEGDLDKKEEFEVFNGRIVPGQHQVAVKLNFRGHGFGVFSYLEGYKFKVQSSYTFDAEPGKITSVKVVAYEKGGITTDLKDRPAVRYDLERSTDAAIKKGSEGEAPAAQELK